MKNKKIGIVLMTYGSATTAEHVEEYFTKIYGGKASRELVEDFARRYRLVGYSPLIDITREQARHLEKKLGKRYVVQAGMRHSEPSIENAIIACKKKGAKKLLGIILSPQFSSFIMDGYNNTFEKAAQKAGYSENEYHIAKAWPTEPRFIELLAKRTRDKMTILERIHGKRIPVIFTTHSLPERVVAKDPGYLDELDTTRKALLVLLRDLKLEWYAGYQSAGHTPEPWLKPDLTDILDKVKGKTPAVLIVPIQFLADHLEILYDLDFGGSEQCADREIAYHRIELPNTHPLFIGALADIVKRESKRSL